MSGTPMVFFGGPPPDERSQAQKLDEQKIRVGSFEEALPHLYAARAALREVAMLDVDGPLLAEARSNVALTIDRLEVEVLRANGALKKAVTKATTE